MPLSKPFAIATEGPTIDGRNIGRDWITQMAANYAPSTYTALSNLEHYLSSLPDSIFGAYGKVVSLSTRETEILGEKKLQLMAVVDANDELVALQKKGKKAFPSIEVLPNFANKGIAYLTGLAFTDQPASLATETMKFSLAGAQGERYAFKDEIEIQFEVESTNHGAGETLFSKVKNLLGLGQKDTEARFADQGKAVETIAMSQKDLLDKHAKLEKEFSEQGAGIKELKESLAAQEKDFAALKTTLGQTDGDGKNRPAAAGGDGVVKTDC